MVPLLIALLFAGPMVAEEPMVTRPSWIQRPTAEDVGRVTPRIFDGPAEVRVLITCRITAEGRLEACTIKAEDPPGLGYGAAALALAPIFKMPAVDLDGRPVAGRMVQIPVIWKNAPE